MTLFWHDYETFGINPTSDRASQFAGIRTDENFDIIEDPINIYCKPADDFLPQPEACLVTGITPQIAAQNGIPEAEFFKKIHEELGRPGTCGLGYNTISFDDEFTRYGFYRNFIDPYAREWQSGNSRWDLINVLRMIHAINPDAFNVEYNEEGKPSFRLEILTKMNNISHLDAHDALSDVIATIEMAKIAKNNCPEYFQQLYEQRFKHNASALINSGKPFIMAESYFGHKNHYLEILYPVAQSSRNKNEVFCVKINHDLNTLMNKSPEEVNEIMFNSDIEEKIPLHSVKINKCPIVLPSSILNKDIAQRIGFNGELCKHNLKKIKDNHNLSAKVQSIFSQANFQEYTDPDQMLYSRFFNNKMDKYKISEIRDAKSSELVNINIHAGADDRIPELLFRYIGRNYPEHFNSEQKKEWLNFCRNRVTNSNSISSITLNEYYEKIKELKESDEFSNHDNKQEILNALKNYGEQIEKKLGLSQKKIKNNMKC